jgi:hypothetical protein
VSEENEAKAKQMGWVPKEDFRGDESKWVDADEFVERGEQIMPILKKNNERLLAENNETKRQLEELRALHRNSQEAIDELKKFHSADTQRQVDKAKKELLAGIKQAKRDGDVDVEEDLRQELEELKGAEKGAQEKTAALPPPPQPVVDPDFISWRGENDWFEKDMKRTALMMGIATEIRNDPANNGLRGRAFYDKASREADAILNPSGRKTSKLEEGGSRGDNGSAGPKGKSFSDLPSEAREVCKRQTPKLVGEGRAFKTEKEWQAHYVEQYFQGE